MSHPSTESFQESLKEAKAEVKLPTIDIKGKEYITVDTRVQEFHRLYPNGMINTVLMSDINSNRIVMKATVHPNNSESQPHRYFNGWAQEMIGDGFINKASALENCETSAVGRALGFLGIGLVGSIATADEVNKATDMAKSPDLNRPTTEQKQEIIRLSKILGVSPTADDNQAYTSYLLEAIGTPSAQNQQQARQLLAQMTEDVKGKEIKPQVRQFTPRTQRDPIEGEDE